MLNNLGTYSATNDIKFKTSMIGTISCDNSDAYIHVKRTITVPNTADASAPVIKKQYLKIVLLLIIAQAK